MARSEIIFAALNKYQQKNANRVFGIKINKENMYE